MKFEAVEVMPPVKLRFTHSIEKYGTWLAKFGATADVGGSQAQETCMVSDDGEVMFFVWMTPCLDYDAADDAGLLTHEAVHIADDYFKHQIEEDNPSDELKAYVTQNVAAHLIKKHYKWKRKRLNRA